MANTAKEIQGRVKNQLEVECVRQSTEIVMGKGINICMANEGMYLPQGQHIHAEFEFLMPISFSIVSCIDHTRMLIEKNRMFAVNSEQPHGPNENLYDFRFLCIEVKKEYMSDLSGELYGRPDVAFANKSNRISNEEMFPVWMILKESRNRQTGYEMVMQGLEQYIAINLLRSMDHNLHQKETKIYSHKSGVDKAIEYMKENLDAEFSMESLAGIANISIFHFIRIFKTQTGMTPYDFLVNLKIEKAKEMLQGKGISITEVCFACGFKNLGHFTDTFRKRVGMPPSQYRRLIND